MFSSIGPVDTIQMCASAWRFPRRQKGYTRGNPDRIHIDESRLVLKPLSSEGIAPHLYTGNPSTQRWRQEDQ